MPTQLRYPAVKTARQKGWAQIAGEMLRMALWGICGALAVLAFAMIQKAPEVRAATQDRNAAEIAQENQTYCEKWGMRAGTREHAACTLDLDTIRANEAKRLAVDMQGLL
jgi:hypothetical protein